MSHIGTDKVERLAMLARIAVTPEQASQLSVELGQIVEFVRQLESADIEGVPPTDQVTGLTNVTREDVVVAATQSRDEMLSNAPTSENGYIVVKRVRND